MFRSPFQIVVVSALLVLLGVLAVLQYAWLGRVSDAEKERLTRRMQSDASRLADDFNREITSVYSNFQTGPDLWKTRNWQEFAERVEFWRGRAEFPELVRDFYYVEREAAAPVLRWDADAKSFVATERTPETEKLAADLFGPTPPTPIDRANVALRINFADHAALEKILFTSARMPPAGAAPGRVEVTTVARPETPDAPATPPRIEVPPSFGVLVIKLDETAIRDRILPALAAREFPDGDFTVAVADGDRVVYGAANASADLTTGIFDISPDNMIFVRNSLPAEVRDIRLKSVVVNRTQSVSRIEARGSAGNSNRSDVRMSVFSSTTSPRPEVAMDDAKTGNWTLSVRHVAGSIDTYVDSGRRQSLAVSFGILFVLAGCVVAIFVSAYRARVFAQRQVDFVSSMSHEFRTPVAVIYSAGENLADGVARGPEQIERYGRLIRKEGRKLSNMVEQILEFAGAGSGVRRFDLAESDAREIVRSALVDCEPLLAENGFEVETDFGEAEALVRADRAALERAVGNLVVNAVKYSNGAKWLRVTVDAASGGGGDVAIVVADRGFGIAPSDRKRVFDPFFRARDVVDRQISGSGLGLSLVRETVLAHGGRVRVDSELGKGSAFTIELPRAKAGS